VDGGPEPVPGLVPDNRHDDETTPMRLNLSAVCCSGSPALECAIHGEATGVPASTVGGEYQNQVQDVRHRDIGRLMIQSCMIWHILSQVTH
jgi:hypothetical protein